MTDGGVADSLPVREARLRGATEITVIRTRPFRYVKEERCFFDLSADFQGCPAVCRGNETKTRGLHGVGAINSTAARWRARFEIAPPSDIDVGRITTDIKLCAPRTKKAESTG